MNIELADRTKDPGYRRSTIGLKVSTKERIDRCRAPGQCYDGFLQQMVDYWEKNKGNTGY